MGLLGGIFNNGSTLRQHRRQHQIHGSAHAGHIQINLTALQPPRLGGGAHIPLFHPDLGPQRRQALQMLVNGPASEVAPAGHGHLRRAEPAQHGPQQIIAGPELPPRVIGHRLAPHMAAVHLHSGAVDDPHAAAQLSQNVQQKVHIADLRNIFNAARPLHQQGGGDNAHRRVFRAADLNFTIERSPAMNDIFFQTSAPLIPGSPGVIKKRGQAIPQSIPTGRADPPRYSPSIHYSTWNK